MSVKRLLDCTPSDLAAYSKTDLLAAIAGSEGRVLACETIGLTPPLLVDVTNAEYAAALSVVLAQNDGLPVSKNLQRGVRRNAVGIAQFLRQDHAVQTVNAANDTGRNHLSNLL